MDSDIKNISKLFERFKDQDACKEYLEFKRWGNNVICPHCNHANPYRTNRGYTCSKKECRKKFTVTSGTIMDKTKIELKKWLAAIFLFTTSKKVHSSVYVADILGITQKTAWFMLQRIRVMLMSSDSSDLLTDIVEVDETYVGGKYKKSITLKGRMKHKAVLPRIKSLLLG